MDGGGWGGWHDGEVPGDGAFPEVAGDEPDYGGLDPVADEPGWPEPDLDAAAVEPDGAGFGAADLAVGGDAGFADAEGFDLGDPVADPPAGLGVTGAAESGDPAGEVPLVGGDPDREPLGDDPGWFEALFPPRLDLLDPPAPVDGPPWADPEVLGGQALAEGGPTLDWYGPGYGLVPSGGWLAPTPGELGAFDAGWAAAPASPGGWAGLLGSDDPATSGLARWWSAAG